MMKTLFSAWFVLLWLCHVAAGAEAPSWVEQKNVAFLSERMADGDSFGMTVESAKGRELKRTYRLYGVDCPESDEKDPLVVSRIQEQAEYFKVTPEEIPAWGKKAAAFTTKLLLEGRPKILTLGRLGEKVEKAKGRPQRYYALVEVTAADGRRRWLSELLLESGLARAHGTPAPWPVKDVQRHGRKKTQEDFMKDLQRLESKAARARAGIWEGAPVGRIR